MKCILCRGETVSFHSSRKKRWFKCLNCEAVLLDLKNYLSGIEEKERYLEHNNDVNDPQYQKFVMPVVDCIKKNYNSSHSGLDFGCGTGPVISKILNDNGYTVELYDPYFHNNPDLLTQKYDYIVCCEVIEHFHNPDAEFKLLRSLMKNNSRLICMTILYSDNINFTDWFYKNDSTHVVFYQKKTLDWIRQKYNFSGLTINNRLIEFCC